MTQFYIFPDIVCVQFRYSLAPSILCNCPIFRLITTPLKWTPLYGLYTQTEPIRSCERYVLLTKFFQVSKRLGLYSMLKKPQLLSCEAILVFLIAW